MKYHPKAVADIIENLREFAADDAILRYTLERLTLETPMNRKRVLDALKSGKAGRPNRLASTDAMFKEIEREIKHFGLELTTLKNRKVTEKEIIEWLIEKEVFKRGDPNDSDKKTVETNQDKLEDKKPKDKKKLVKTIQDKLSRYRKRLSQKPP